MLGTVSRFPPICTYAQYAFKVKCTVCSLDGRVKWHIAVESKGLRLKLDDHMMITGRSVKRYWTVSVQCAAHCLLGRSTEVLHTV